MVLLSMISLQPHFSAVAMKSRCSFSQLVLPAEECAGGGQRPFNSGLKVRDTCYQTCHRSITVRQTRMAMMIKNVYQASSVKSMLQQNKTTNSS